MVMVLGLMGGVMGANSGFPSTNDENREKGHPHVNLVSAGEDYVTLEFVMNYDFLAFFEYRIDGEESPYIGTEWENTHPIVDEDGNWRYDDPDFPDFTDPGPGNHYYLIGLDPSGEFGDPRVVNDNSRKDTFDVDEKIEIRLALGAERDYDFDWVTFYVEEYEAAPAVAARLLDDAGVANRYGQGRTGGNFVADVAHRMGPGTDFDGVSKEDVEAYECAIAAFLNDPANGDYYPAGVECTPVIKQLQTEMYIEWDNGTAIESQEFTRENDYLRFYGEVDGTGNGHLRYAYGTVAPVDLTGVENVYVSWSHSSTDNQNQDRSFFGIDTDRNKIIRDYGDVFDVEEGILNGDTSFETKTDSLDVSGVDGDRHIGVGIELSSNNAQFVELKVFDVWGEDDDGNRVFEFVIPGN